MILSLSEGHDAEFAAADLDKWYRNFSRPESSEEEMNHKLKTLEKYAAKGFAIGPFSRPPFPNSRISSQATVNDSFTVPKDKLEIQGPTSKRRYIVHASKPDSLSYNFKELQAELQIPVPISTVELQDLAQDH